MLPIQASTATGAEISAPSSKVAPSQNEPPSIAVPATRQAAAIRNVTAGPAAAIRNSTPGLSGSRFSARDATEHPQGDLGDPDPVAERDHRVADLVQQDRAEEPEGADHREGVGLDRVVRVESSSS